tara:strand:+ start:1618 stop:2601 length:984 start_codon:yes stop_codon:yes gene_type:complete
MGITYQTSKKPKVSFVTTFSKFIYDSYGNDLVDDGDSLLKSWERYSNGNILNVFSEDDFHISEKNVVLHKLSEGTGIYEFINSNKNKPYQLTTKQFYDNFLPEGYSRDVYLEHEKKGAVKYCFKVFCWLQSLSLGADRTLFLDADFIIKNPIDPNKIYDLLEDEYCCGVLERNFDNADEWEKNIHHNRGMLMDSCFLIFNNRHEQIWDFISDIINFYSTGNIFSLPYWHDTYIFHQVMNEYKKRSVKFKNLSPTFSHDRRGPLHPTSNWKDIETGSELSQIKDIFEHYGGVGKLKRDQETHRRSAPQNNYGHSMVRRLSSGFQISDL